MSNPISYSRYFKQVYHYASIINDRAPGAARGAGGSGWMPSKGGYGVCPEDRKISRYYGGLVDAAFVRTVTTAAEAEISGLVLSRNEAALEVGKELQIELIANFEDGSSENVTKKAAWSVDNYSVATVVNGMVTGKKSGNG